MVGYASLLAARLVSLAQRLIPVLESPQRRSATDRESDQESRRSSSCPQAWAVQRARYMTLETIARLSEGPIFKLPAVTA